MSKKVSPTKEKLHCSFCGKAQDEVRRLVAGPGVYICDECISLCNEIIAEEPTSTDKPAVVGDIPKPVEIKKILDQYVIGQDRAKKALSVAVYNHYKRIYFNDKKQEVELEKSNILLIGPTGSGKTLLAQTLARILKVPFAIVDATALTEAGYVGEDVENIILKLIQNADNDVKKAELGIIYIDEIDKITRKSDSASITRDVSGEGVQQALLKIIEGTVANVPPQGGRKHPHQEYITIDTKNILFICGGAFVGLDNIIKNRIGTKTIGFSDYDTSPNINKRNFDQDESVIHQGIPDDLLKFGLIPEFVGRLPIMASLDELTLESLKSIFSEPKNAIMKQYIKIFELENVRLKFTDEAISVIAEEAIKRESGARGLRAIVEDTMMDLMFQIPSRKDVLEVVVTGDVIRKKETPIVILKGDIEKIA